MNRLPDPSRPGKRSSALVFTLLTMVLLTVVVVVFFSSVTANREIENSRTHDVQADQMARTAMDYVANRFLQEITSSANSTTYTANGTTIYAPKVNTNAVPNRLVGTGIPSTPLSSATNFFNLIRQSIPSVADPNASGDSTSVAASNGRVMGLDRWNAPMLVPGAGYTATSQLPNWIYVSRITGPSPIVSTNTIGRFAYNVYDIGRLLNVNAAGYSSTIAASPDTISILKSTLAGADLTQLSTSIHQIPDIDKLINFRNPDTSADTNAYVSMVQASAAAGFLTPTVTNLTNNSITYSNNYFNSRQDFLRYARTQNPPLTNAAPYLTTFSKSVNSASWFPPTIYGVSPTTANSNYSNMANTVTSPNRFVPNVRAVAAASIPHYNDDGTLGTPTIVQAGDSLLQRRFSLAKLAWIAHGGPSNSTAFASSLTAAQRAAAIQACFGLVWDTSPNLNGDPNFTSDARWDYVGPSAAAIDPTMPTTIETLDQISKEATAREPNFFELLQAGILTGSLGTNGGHALSDASNGGVYMDATNTAYQVFRIGANLIDQTTPDNYPTAIECVGNEKTVLNGVSPSVIEVYGIKDLPYFNKLYPVFYWPTANYSDPAASSTTLPSGPVYNYLAFELWNPHQASSSTILQNGPTLFRIRVAADTSEPNGGEFCIGYVRQQRDPATQVPVRPVVAGTIVWNSADGLQDLRSFVTDPNVKNSPLVFAVDGTSTNPQLSYREPYLIRNVNNAANVSPANTQFSQPPDAEDPNLVAIDMGTSTTAIPDGPVGNNCQFELFWTVFVLEYQDTDGNWRPYTTYVGRPDRVVTGIYGNAGGTGGRQVSTVLRNQNAPYTKGDPRTIRFDSQSGGNIGLQFLAYNGPAYGGPQPATSGSWRPNSSLNPGIASGSSLNFFTDPAKGYMGMLACNLYYLANEFYPDPDSQVRWGDAYGGLSSPTLASIRNPFRENDATVSTAADPSARPIILGRPFRSVAEMGYAYRDENFKTLDFWTSMSGDSALLDLFSVNDEPPVTAGKVDLATIAPIVQQSLLSQAPGVANPTGLATDYTGITRTPATTLAFPTTNVVRNVAQLPNFLYADTSTTSALRTTYVKTVREAPVRALASPTQTRTWNLLIDVVAQAGRFPGATTTAGNFVVDGEKHCWLSIAIDRYTGKVVDQQIEFINE